MKTLKVNSFVRVRSDGEGYHGKDGKWIDGEKQRTPFKGSFQPLGSTSREIQEVLPEGVLLDDVRVVYTRQLDLRTGSDRTGIEADDVEFMGKTYEVFKVDTWYAVKKLSHVKAFVILKDRDSND